MTSQEFFWNSTVTSSSTMQEIEVPNELRFTVDNIVSIVAYSVLFVISACGNLLVFITLFRNRKRKSRVNLFIMHLSVADMFVTFVMIPMEIGWHATVAWVAGDVACRLFMFLRTFGFYLSSFILITISLDRCFAITQPMNSINGARRRARRPWIRSLSRMSRCDLYQSTQWITRSRTRSVS